MIPPIRAGAVLGATPVARVRRKISVRERAIENASPENRDDADGESAQDAHPITGDTSGLHPEVGSAVMAALLTLPHGG